MLPLFKVVEVAATQCTPGMGHGQQPGDKYACYEFTLKGCSGVNPMAANWNPKAESKHHTRHQLKEIGGRCKLQKENLLQEDPWHNWH